VQKQQKTKTPEEQMSEFCGNMKLERFSYLGALQTIKAGSRLFGFVVKTTRIQDPEKYLPKPEFPQEQPAHPDLYRDAVLAIFEESGTLTAKEIAAIVLDGKDIKINPFPENGAITVKISCECPPTSWENKIMIPLNISSCPEPAEIVLFRP
jgi:hypothetical protein